MEYSVHLIAFGIIVEFLGFNWFATIYQIFSKKKKNGVVEFMFELFNWRLKNLTLREGNFDTHNLPAPRV